MYIEYYPKVNLNSKKDDDNNNEDDDEDNFDYFENNQPLFCYIFNVSLF